MRSTDAVHARTETYDVAILGAGLAGGLLAAVLARNGVTVLLIDAGTHPRFAVGESTIPVTSGMLRLIAERYGVPEIKALSSFKGIQRYVSPQSGRKQNFGFVYHVEGQPQDPTQINQLVVPSVLRTESHLFRQDVDAYLFHVAVKYGAVPRLNTRVTEVEIDPAEGAVLRADGGLEFRARYVVDAGGFRSPLAEKFALRDNPTRARTHTRALFTHMIGVRPFDDAPSARRHVKPNPWHNGTLHHCFDGGWVWVIPFDNHPGAINPLCSVGLTLDPRKYPKPDGSAEEEWNAFLRRYPDIAWQFENAVAVRPWTSTGRLQYSSKQVVGDRFCLTSHAAGFIDALYSRGMVSTTEVVNALAWRLIAAARDGDWSTERFEYVERLHDGVFEAHDTLVHSGFVGFSDYRLWNAANRVWQISTMVGNIVIEDAYYRFMKTGDDQVFKDMEQTRYPGSPFPQSESFNTLLGLTRQTADQVEAGALDPAEGAARIFECINRSDYLPPAFGLGLPDNHCFNVTPAKMVRNAVWGRRHAPAEIGAMTRRASAGLLRMRLRG